MFFSNPRRLWEQLICGELAVSIILDAAANPPLVPWRLRLALIFEKGFEQFRCTFCPKLAFDQAVFRALDKSMSRLKWRQSVAPGLPKSVPAQRTRRAAPLSASSNALFVSCETLGASSCPLAPEWGWLRGGFLFLLPKTVKIQDK
jgi:hypothetical protein